MRPEKLSLLDIVDAADAIKRFCETVNNDEFLHDELRQSAVLQKMIVIGEAAARLPKQFQRHYFDIEWADIIGFRNIAVHQYFAINWEIVWATAMHDIPVLRDKISIILAQDYQEK